MRCQRCGAELPGVSRCLRCDARRATRLIWGACLLLACGAAACWLGYRALMPHHIAPMDHVARSCAAQQRRLAEAMLLYAQEHDGHLPRSWAAAACAPQLLTCPAAPSRAVGYGLNRGLLGKLQGQVDDPVTIILTADGGDAAHYLSSLQQIDSRRHTGDYYVASFLDGHVEALPATRPVRL